MSRVTRWTLRLAALLVALIVYTIWKDLERQLGFGFPSAVLRGAAVFGFIVWVWYATRASASSSVAEKVDEQPLYALVASEIEKGDINKGLWTKCFSESDGDENITKAKYIKTRVADLKAKHQEAIRAEKPTPETHVRCPECRLLIPRESRVCRSCGCKLVPQ